MAFRVERLRTSHCLTCHFPLRCLRAPENEVLPFEVRQLLYGRKPHVYRVIFSLESETVYVFHIWHGRRKPISTQ